MFRCLQFDFRSRCVLASVLTDRIRVNEALNPNTNVHIHIYIFILHIPYTIYMQIILILSQRAKRYSLLATRKLS